MSEQCDLCKRATKLLEEVQQLKIDGDKAHEEHNRIIERIKAKQAETEEIIKLIQANNATVVPEQKQREGHE